jgi:hypothetical protein
MNAAANGMNFMMFPPPESADRQRPALRIPAEILYGCREGEFFGTGRIQAPVSGVSAASGHGDRA